MSKRSVRKNRHRSDFTKQPTFSQSVNKDAVELEEPDINASIVSTELEKEWFDKKPEEQTISEPNDIVEGV